MRAGPVSVSTVGGIAADAVVTRARGKLYATVIAKASFELRAGGDMVPIAAEPLVRQEQHHGGSPARSVRATSELLPYLPAADVVFTGHAHAPAGPARVVDVRLAVWGERLLVDKILRVQASEPFDKLPIVYERAYGGVGVPENPLGTGAAAKSAAPNIVDPRAKGAPVPAGFGPISVYWHARKRMTKPSDSGPIQEIPDDFDWSYFLASPPDQRAPYLAGSEWVYLENLLPGGGQVRSRLPDLRAFARIRWTPNGEAGAPAPLQADMLHVDGDAGRCSVVFRGVFALPDGVDLHEVRAAVAISIASAPIDWALATREGQADDLSATLARTSSRPSDGPVSLGGTLIVDPPAEAGVALPFRSAPSTAPRAHPLEKPLPGTPWSGVKATPARRPVSSLATTVFDEAPPPAMSRGPALEGPPPPTPPPAVPPKPPPPPGAAAPPAAQTQEEPTPVDRDGPVAPSPAPGRPRAPTPPEPAGPAAVLTFVRKGGYDRFKR